MELILSCESLLRLFLEDAVLNSIHLTVKVNDVEVELVINPFRFTTELFFNLFLITT